MIWTSISFLADGTKSSYLEFFFFSDPRFPTKGNSISKTTQNLVINVFPAKIWIFKFLFCLKETIEMITLKIQSGSVTQRYYLLKSILMAKIMRKKNLKIQIFAGNTLISRFHVGFEILLPLVFLLSPSSSTQIHVCNGSTIHYICNGYVLNRKTNL